MLGLIQALKDNEWLAYGGWSLDMRTEAHRIGYSHFQVRSHGTMKWGFIPGGFHDVLILRLRPDYEEKPEIEEVEIKVQAAHTDFPRLEFLRGHWHGIDNAPRFPDFIGFKYAGYSDWFNEAIMYEWNGKLYREIQPDWINSGNAKVVRATHVLFRSNQ